MNTITAPTCPVCLTRECELDWEPGCEPSHYSTCSSCSGLNAAAPYCHNHECSARICGTRTVLISRGPEVTRDNAIYSCPNGCGQATAVGWAKGSGISTARHDVQYAKVDTSWAGIVEVRMTTGIASGYDAEHPVARAYARAYVDTVNALRTA